jgi:hypothetical protein
MNFEVLLPFLLYAETHYSFKGVYSRLKKKEPEVIIDIPHRIEPGESIPVLLLIKDSHLFPVEIHTLKIALFQNSHRLFEKEVKLATGIIRQKYYSIIIELEPLENVTGLVFLDVKIELSTKNKRQIYYNDNYRISSHDPFEVYLAEKPLPKTADWYFGDIHCHSSYTEDQAEFGAPLTPSIQLSKAMGLSFFAINDHSYDLDDEPDNYLKNDPNLAKWKTLKHEVDQLNKEFSDFVILPGEEVSVGNSKNRNVHFLIIANSEFIPGKGDGAEKWLRTEPDLSISEVLNKIDSQSLAIAAHSEIDPPFLEWLLIRRGKWNWKDYLHDRLDGLQIWNGTTDKYFFKGIQQWVDLLLNGQRLFIYAGNDAHGNFNRFRQIGFPFWTMKEHGEQIFGKIRTGVKVNDDFNQANLLTALRNGQVIITDGPFCDFTISNQQEEKAIIGQKLTGKSFQINIEGLSSPEFGAIARLTIFCGSLDERREFILKQITDFESSFEFHFNQTLSSLPNNCYIRMDLKSSKNNYCLTNPIWLNYTTIQDMI